jgi:GNAT superfamily N-acetyltransferase
MSRTMTCHCGALLTAEDTESLVSPVKEHFDVAHPEFGLTETSVRNYLESEDRSTGPTDRLGVIGEVEVRPITADSGPDVVQFFDRDAFPDNPAWGSCYCMFYPRGGRDNENWGDVTWQENRRDQLSRIAEGKTTGMLAYVEGRLAGWCNATARSALPGLARGDDDGVRSVVCFAIAPPYRGHGVARRLLDGVIATSAAEGFTRLEAYPVRDPADQRAAYHGSLALFQEFGFEVTSEDPLVVELALS